MQAWALKLMLIISATERDGLGVLGVSGRGGLQGKRIQLAQPGNLEGGQVVEVARPGDLEGVVIMLVPRFCYQIDDSGVTYKIGNIRVKRRECWGVKNQLQK